MKFVCINEKSTRNLAKQLAEKIAKYHQNSAFIIYLSGDLGAGKTTFARGFIQHFGFGKVKSPTYTIVESYEQDIVIHHFDLYRLSSSEELEIIGVKAYFDHICLIEWAENVQNNLPKNDLLVELTGNTTRKITITAHSRYGEKLLNYF